MKAARINEWGQAINIEDIPEPTPNSDEVLVRVHAASLNPLDSVIHAGYLQFMLSVPMTLGTDFAGEVIRVGANVKHVSPGDAVYGMTPLRGGAFAEYALAKSHEVAIMPQTLSYVQSAAVPLAALAAWQSLFDLAQVQSEERVLILGAGGNVGAYVIQLAKAKGIYVIGCDLPEKVSFMQELGADQVIDVQAQSFEDVVDKVDVVLNFANADLFASAYNVLNSGGRYVSAFMQAEQEEAERRGIRSFGLATEAKADQLLQIAELIDTGKLKVFVNSTFAFKDVQTALEYRQQNTKSGKVVLTF